MAQYHIKNKSKPEDLGTLVGADNQAQALRKVVESQFEVVSLNADEVSELAQNGVPFFKETPNVPQDTQN